MMKPATEPCSRWLAAIDLGFERHQRRTVLARRRHQGPLRVQKPFYPEEGVCHVYLLHPPGGVAGQDDLTIHITVEQQASALLTTPAANKVYRSGGMCSGISQTMEVAADASLEWLPQGTILFGGSRLRQGTDIRLRASSRLCAWDVLCLGRPASGDEYLSGTCQQSWTVWVENRPIFVDRLAWSAGSSLSDAAWGLGGYKVTGLLVMYRADSDVLEHARRRLQSIAGVLTSATLLDELLVIRALGDNGQRVQSLMSELWSSLRPLVLGRTACLPRIWST